MDMAVDHGFLGRGSRSVAREAWFGMSHRLVGYPGNRPLSPARYASRFTHHVKRVVPPRFVLRLANQVCPFQGRGERQLSRSDAETG